MILRVHLFSLFFSWRKQFHLKGKKWKLYLKKHESDESLLTIFKNYPVAFDKEHDSFLNGTFYKIKKFNTEGIKFNEWGAS